MEVWKTVPGHGDHYEASSLGRVRSLDRFVYKNTRYPGVTMKQFYKGRVLSPSKQDRLGHTSVHISVDNEKINLPVHRAVLLAFVGQPPEGMEACHNNSIPDDNRLENLRWDTHYNNNQDRKKRGKYAAGKDHPMALFDEAVILSIYRSNERGCVLAKKHGVSQTHVSNIRLGKTWIATTGGMPRRKINTMGPTPRKNCSKG